MGPVYVQGDPLHHSILAESREDCWMLVFLLVFMLNPTIHTAYSWKWELL